MPSRKGRLFCCLHSCDMAAISFLAQGIGKLALFDDYVRQSNALLAMARREGSGSMRICLNDVKRTGFMDALSAAWNRRSAGFAPDAPCPAH